MKINNREIPDHVEFRVRQHEEEFARRLEISAREAGRTVSDQARELLKNALTSPDLLQHAVETLQQDMALIIARLDLLVQIKDGIRMVHENVYQFRDDLAACVAKILVDAGRLDAKAAQNWVTKTLDTE
jgi:plasmid stability protein